MAVPSVFWGAPGALGKCSLVADYSIKPCPVIPAVFMSYCPQTKKTGGDLMLRDQGVLLIKQLDA